MSIDRHNCESISFMGHQLARSSKWNISRALRRFLQNLLVPNTSRPQALGELMESRKHPTCMLFQMFASPEEGYSPEQLEALAGYALGVKQRMHRELQAQAPGVRALGVMADVGQGLVCNHFELSIDLKTASLKELQEAATAVTLVADFLMDFADHPNQAALWHCPTYVYRGLGCDIASDDRLWAVNGHDLIHGGSGVLEWCYDEEDARRVLQTMQEHSYQFRELSATSYLEMFRSGNIHPLLKKPFEARAV